MCQRYGVLASLLFVTHVTRIYSSNKHDIFLSNVIMQLYIISVVIPEQKTCQNSQPLQVKQTSGYLASSITFKTSCGSHGAPWLIEAEPGQRINITLHDFTRGYHTVSDNRGLHHSTTCYAVIKEQSWQRDDVKVCGGGAKVHHVMTSSSNRVELRILQGSIDRRSYFLIKFESKQL